MTTKRGRDDADSLKSVKALLFDTFGTVVDWRGSIAREGTRFGTRHGIDGVDWEAFADSWRAGYGPGMAKVSSGQRPWVPIDVIHRERLDVILEEYGISSRVDEAMRVEMNLWWHILDPWPDSVPGLRRLSRDYIIGPLSNGSTILLVTMAKRAAIPWDVIMSSDVCQAYKPQDAAYLNACSALGLRPDEVMMCAAHNGDLLAASKHGMRTAFICRPTEHGANQKLNLCANGPWDVCTDHIGGIADALLAPQK